MSSTVSRASRWTEAIYELREFQQVCQAEERTPLPKDELWIRSDDVGPLRRNRADRLLIDPQQQASSVAGVPLADAEELLSTQWMKGMRDPYKVRRYARNICILD